MASFLELLKAYNIGREKINALKLAAYKKTGDLAIQSLVSPAKPIISFGIEGAKNILDLARVKQKGPLEYQPKGIMATLLGKEPIKPISKVVEEKIVSPASKGKAVTAALGGVGLLAGTTLESLGLGGPGGGKKKAVEEGVSALKTVVPKVAEAVKKSEIFRVGNLRLDKFNIPKIAQEELGNIIKGAGEFVEQRRGVLSFEKTQELANAINPKINLKPGTSLNAEEIQALGDTVASLKTKADDIAKKVSGGDNSEVSLLRLQEAQQELALALSSYSGATAEAGRALSILRNTRKAISSNDPELIREALKLSGGRVKAEEVAKRLVQFGDDEVAKYRYLRDLQKPEFSDYLTWFYYSNILSGPLTHIKNLTANALNLGFDVSTKPFQAGVDLAKSLGARVIGKERPRQVTLSEIPYDLKGAWQGMKDGAKKALFMFRNGFSLDNVAQTEFRVIEPIKGIAPNIVSRSLQAEDQFFRSIFSGRELWVQAFQLAKQTGKKGKALSAEIARLVADPTTEMIKNVAKAGAKGVFQQQAGDLAGAIIKLRDWKIPGTSKYLPAPFKFVIPFISTPINILKTGIEYTPAGLISSKFAGSAREASKIQGRSLAGSGVLAYLAVLAGEGRVSGNGPQDPDLKDALYQQGWQPNSIKVGDKWYSYQTLPIAFPLSLVGNAYDLWQYENEKPSVAAILAKGANSFLNQSFLSGLNNLGKVLENPAGYSETFITNFLRSWIPASSALGQVARAFDTNIRQPEGIKQGLQAGIPGFTQSLPPRISTLGTESKRPGSFFNQFNPIKVSKETENGVLTELKNANYTISFPGKSINKRKLSKETYSRFAKMSGQIKGQLLSKVFATDGYQKLTESQKQDLIKKIVDKANFYARDNFAGEAELDFFSIPHDELGSDVREILFKVVDTKEYKAMNDKQKKKVISAVYNRIAP